MPTRLKYLPLAIAFLAIFLFSVSPAISLAAMSFTVDEIIGHPSELPVGGEIEVRVSFGNISKEKQYYLFLSFRKPGNGAYNFGFTQNNDGDWIKYGEKFDNFYKVEIKESSWSGILKVRPDYEASGFKGEGEYQVRAGRYVGSNSATWTVSQDLKIFLKAPVPTPTPNSKPTEENEEETIFITPTPTSTPTPKAVELAATFSGEVLGEENQPRGIYLLEPSPSPGVIKKRESKQRLPIFSLAGGFIFLAVAGLYLWYTKWRCPG